MARTPNVPQEPHPGFPPAETSDEFLASLLALREPVDAACEGKSARVKAALQVIAGGINTLADAIRTDANLERDSG